MFSKINLPRRVTILGFCFFTVVLVVIGGTSTAAALAGTKEGFVVPYVLAFVGLFVVVIVWTILRAAFSGKSPLLQLHPELSPDDYRSLLNLGDSVTGTRPIIDATPRRELAPETGESSRPAISPVESD
jgi:hypothetical protein